MNGRKNYKEDSIRRDLKIEDIELEEIGKREIWLFLNNLKSMNNRYLQLFEDYFGDIREIWECKASDLDKLLISEKVKKDILLNRNEDFLREIIFNAKKNKIEIMTIEDRDYPINLKNIEDPPRVLYYKGEIKRVDNQSISIIGPRKPSAYGIYAVQKLADEIARYGITIVSGMASGIDTYAHMVALRRKTRTIAVLGTGVDRIYPAHNKNVYWNIIKSGAVVSEFPIGTQGFPYNFPQRNRIISGLSLGTLVIEAEKRSGTLITCNHALEQGKEVFAVPGNINSKFSHGTNKMIKEGAKLVEGIEDIVEEIAELKKIKEEEDIKDDKIKGLGNDENEIIMALKTGPKTIDEIIDLTNMGVVKINGLITVLELKGKLKRLSDNRLSI
ncbi:MAG: DNA-processing protein DprA [Andreesenia angusta]|nr:DNA-processing protein DprA [Andreesenia angusta]